MKKQLLAFALAFSSACGPTSSGSDAGGSGDAGKADAGTLPCDVQRLVASHCQECHGAKPEQGAPFSLVTRADVKDAAARMQFRMQAGTMPPAPRASPSALEQSLFAAWIDAGYPETGTCTPLPDAGTPDAGAPTTCASNVFYNQLLEPPGELMNPGLSCPTCHAANQLFYVAFTYAGTVMPGLHEKNTCKSPPTADGGIVEIAALDGGVFWQWEVNSSGNFRTLDAGPSPYVARLYRGGMVKQNQTTHTSGDCNTCHTEQGANGAAGRLTFP